MSWTITTVAIWARLLAREAKIGIGDQLIASGLAREAWTKRGVKVAFGDRSRVIWDKHSEEVFRNNPNVVFPGNEGRGAVEWVEFHKGQRGYNRQGDGHWIWNMEWRCRPGEIYLTHGEIVAGRRKGKGFVVVEPNVVAWKSSAANKDWGFANYQAVVDRLRECDQKVVQFTHEKGGPLLNGVKTVRTSNFRDAVSILKNAGAYVGAEGGMHHAAAAVGIKGVVLFGGFIPPSVTGYDIHANLAGSERFCGSFRSCQHCREAMASISVDRVFNAAMESLRG